MRGTCANCDRQPKRLRRGLCGRCYKRPEIRCRFACGPRGRRKSQTPRKPRVYLPPPMNGQLCRHCPTGRVCRPRGLCFTCYTDREIRCQYPTQNTPSARRSLAASVTRVDPPSRPAWDAPPGSAKKIEIMVERVRLKQSLFHPQDTTRHDEFVY